jgi:nitrogen regulatory protein PII
MSGKMVMSIVHPEDAQQVTKTLNDAGFRVTQAATRGGFLRHGNVTLMIGVDEDDVDQVMDIIRQNTRQRSRGGWWLRPGRYQEGAVAFVVGMEQARLSEDTL